MLLWDGIVVSVQFLDKETEARVLCDSLKLTQLVKVRVEIWSRAGLPAQDVEGGDGSIDQAWVICSQSQESPLPNNKDNNSQLQRPSLRLRIEPTNLLVTDVYSLSCLCARELSQGTILNENWPLWVWGGTEKQGGQLGVREMGQMAKLCGVLWPGIWFSEAVQLDTLLIRRDQPLAMNMLVQNVGRGTVWDSYKMPNPLLP